MCSSSVCWIGSITGGVTPGTSWIAVLILLGRRQQRVEVVADDLDGDLGVDAGNHVADQVRQRLLDFDVHAGHFLAQLREQLLR